MQNNACPLVSILLVEDDDVDAMGIERAFKKFKVTNPIVRARDGLEALEMLRTNVVSRPYIILLDLNMPRMNGLEMLAELRNDAKLTDSIVFVLTTSKDDTDKTSSYKEHIAGYMVKSSLERGFGDLIKLLDNYGRLVEMPVDRD
ncbi:MAG: two-component system response regulator [Alteromonadaceae bacterium]|nr:MAG: two-component system response regulator [Alteromonadaceae bacterium]